MAQNDKKLCLFYSIFHEAYIIWLSFLVHMCKLVISPDAFFIFLKFWFFRLFGEWNGKKWPKMCLTLYLIWLWFLVHLCEIMISPAIFFIFSGFWFFWVFRGKVKGQKMNHNYQFQSVTLYISTTVDHIIKSVGIQV